MNLAHCPSAFYHNYGPKPIELNPQLVVWDEGVKRQKTSMARKGTGGDWHIPR